MSIRLDALIGERIRNAGPLTAAAFMELALYHPTLGYYTRASKRTGRAGDFYTSVDVGPQFGALLAAQLDEMRRQLASPSFDLVEGAAGNGQLSRDILDASAARYPELYESLRVNLVETSPAARQVHADTLAPHKAKLEASTAVLPNTVTGVIFANELLDALPTPAVTMTETGLAESYGALDGDRLVERLGPPSTPALASYLERLDLDLAPGWRGEICRSAMEWVRTAANRLHRGVMLLVDYGHTADRLYAGHHARGTLPTFTSHLVDAASQSGEGPRGPAWLSEPGDRDITAHVDITSVCDSARKAGLDLLGVVDQSRFLLGLGAVDESAMDHDPQAQLRHRLALKTLLVPGGLGSTHQVMLFGRGVGTPTLAGLSLSPSVQGKPSL